MSGGEGVDVPKFTGLSKIFNSYTHQGRLNTVLATYASCFAFYLYMKFKPSKPAEQKK